MNKHFPPELFLIGAQKAGTTTLASLLDQHPDVSVARKKEPMYFTHHYRRGLFWYRRQFETPGKRLCVDASPTYTMAPLRYPDPDSAYTRVAERLFRIRPDARLVYVLRPPVDRLYSSYWHDVREGNQRNEFRDAITDPARTYLDASDYAGQLRIWYRYFDPQSFLLIRFSDLTADPIAVTRQVFRFMGIRDDVALSEAGQLNPTRLNSPMGRRLNWIMNRAPLVRRLRHTIPETLVDRIKMLSSGTRQIPEMSLSDRQFLEAYFRPGLEDLKRLTGFELEA